MQRRKLSFNEEITSPSVVSPGVVAPFRVGPKGPIRGGGLGFMLRRAFGASLPQATAPGSCVIVLKKGGMGLPGEEVNRGTLVGADEEFITVDVVTKEGAVRKRFPASDYLIGTIARLESPLSAGSEIPPCPVDDVFSESLSDVLDEIELVFYPDEKGRIFARKAKASDKGTKAYARARRSKHKGKSKHRVIKESDEASLSTVAREYVNRGRERDRDELQGGFTNIDTLKDWLDKRYKETGDDKYRLRGGDIENLRTVFRSKYNIEIKGTTTGIS